MNQALTLTTFDAPQRRLDPRLDVKEPDEGWTWPPTSVTLISGEKHAILVDTLPTVVDSTALADWIESSGRDLTTIYITHGHLDHYLGAAALLERFPGARLVATEATARHIAREVESGTERAMYSTMFVDALVATIAVPELLRDDHIELEGHEVLAVATGQSDHTDSSYVHVPELAAVVVGDIAYNDVHPALMGSDHATRQRWIDTLRDVQALHPRIVVAAHRRPDAPNDARALSDTIAYLEEADRALAANSTAAGFVEQMLASGPVRLNASTLMFGAAALGLR